jgi:hypothetical protein
MPSRVLAAGSAVTIQGFPFRLVTDVVVEGESFALLVDRPNLTWAGTWTPPKATKRRRK